MDFQDAISLSQLTRNIRLALEANLSDIYLVVAEIQSFTINRSGHAYLDLIEKSPISDQIISQVKATIWAGQFRIIKPYFESVTGTSLRAGIKILIKARVNYHELYGLSVNILDILPEFTAGELALLRQQTIKKLQDDGIFDMNREIFLAKLVQKIAVISSAGAAGYGDFVNQLKNNQFGYKFYTVLFPAAMQGNTAEDSIIQQLEMISNFSDLFDCVVIIRGGGSKTDLGCFDGLKLCENICQMPLPVITGIGHDRDESVADLVANVHLKTPTAVAQFLIDRANACFSELSDITASIKEKMRAVLERHQKLNHDIVVNFKNTLKNFYTLKHSKLEAVHSRIVGNFKIANQRLKSSEIQLVRNIDSLFRSRLLEKTYQLNEISMKIDLNSPKNILKKGYTYTVVNGHSASSVVELSEGQQITTYFYDGSVTSTVNKISK